jgi:hypothetical protein
LVFTQEGVSLEEGEKMFQKLQYKVKGCVQTAMQLFARMRSGRAQYLFEWIQPGDFQLARMDINVEQRSTVPEKTMAKLRSCDVKVAFCVFPAFIKYGDDDGQNYDRPRVMRQANVIVEGLPAAAASQRQTGREERHSEEDQETALPAKKNQSAESNGHKDARDSMLDDGGKGSKLFSSFRSLVPSRV